MTPKRQPDKRRDLNNLTDLRTGLYCRVSQVKDNDDQAVREKSVDDQEAVGREWVERVGAVLAERHVYRDPGISASRFTTKERKEFARLLEDIAAGGLDLIWFWELSRSQRRLDVFAQLRDLCREMGVLWVLRDRVYDPSSYADMMTLGMLSVISENESEMTSLRVLRGKESDAAAGRPLGLVPYGYRRVYDPVTRRLLRQEPDVFDGDGGAVEDSPAGVVREIFDRIAAGHSLRSIGRDLEDRGISSPRGGRWIYGALRRVATRRSYIGQQVHRGAVLEGVETIWPALIEPETFWAVQRILSDPARVTTRPAAARWLLSGLIHCAVCGGRMSHHNNRKSQSRTGRTLVYTHYICTDRSCAGIKATTMDEYVEEVIVRWLSDPAVCAELGDVGNSVEANRARADAEQLRTELTGWRRAAETGEVTVAGYGAAERGLLRRIAEAEQRAQAAVVPPVLAGNIGPQARAGWARLDLEVKRQIIHMVADVRVVPVGRGRQQYRPGDRVEWRWLLGSDTAPAHIPPSRPLHRLDALALIELGQDGTVTQSELAPRLGVNQATGSHVARRLTQQGLVTRKLAPRNGALGRRGYTLTLTEEGRAAAETLNGDELD